MKNSKKLCQNQVKIQQFGSKTVQYPLSNACFTRQNRLKTVYHSAYANEHGRSMVEMLGVLAVVGVLSIGGIQGYTYAMNKYRSNQILNELNIASHQLATVLLRNENEELELSLGEPYDSGRIASADYAFNYGCGNGLAEEDCSIDETGYWFALNGVPETICKNMMTMVDGMPYLAEKELNGTIVADGTACADENNEITFLFNSDGSGELSENTGNNDGTGGEENGDEDDGTEETPPVDCGEHGKWNFTLNKCQCNTGWSGTVCDKSINDNCEANGHYWVNSRGLCVCKEGFGGLNCDQDPREVCNNRGTWDACGGGCKCESGFMGTYCQNEISNNQYCNNGTWINSEWGNNGYCQCASGYAGKDCSMTQEEANAQYCNDQGVWKSSTAGGKCQCADTFGGKDCSIPNVDKKCNGKGYWSDYSNSCVCFNNNGGVDCSIQNVCSGHGYWQTNTQECSCNDGWGGENCSEKIERCNNGTLTNDGKYCGSYCVCNEGYVGQNCSRYCPNSIETGDNLCTCDTGWAGEDCSVLEKDYCIHGVWNAQGVYCVCENGWQGENCDIPFTN